MTQIQQSDVHRNALHIAQVMKMAREHGPQGYRGGPPERPYYEARPEASLRTWAIRIGAVAGVAGPAAVAGGLVALRR